MLPIKNGEIDFEYMETYIRAIEKVVIRGVVEWKNKVIEATKSVVNTLEMQWLLKWFMRELAAEIEPKIYEYGFLRK